MDIKDIKKLILLAICAFMIGFGCLIFYYIDYSNKTADRHNMSNLEDEILNQQDVLNNMQAQQSGSNINSTKFGETEKEYNYEDYNLDAYYDYVEEQLSLKTDKTEEETKSIYDQTIRNIRLKVLGGFYTEAAQLAYEVMSETVFVDGDQYSNLTNLKSISGFDKMSSFDQKMVLQTMTDPVIYVALFYAMEPEYQVELLKEENFIFVPVQDNHQMALVKLEEAGPMESHATKFFSELSELSIYKITIEVLGIQYDVYLAGRPGYTYRITNVEFTDPTNKNYSTYTDYFNVWGRKETEPFYD